MTRMKLILSITASLHLSFVIITSQHLQLTSRPTHLGANCSVCWGSWKQSTEYVTMPASRVSQSDGSSSFRQRCLLRKCLSFIQTDHLWKYPQCSGGIWLLLDENQVGKKDFVAFFFKPVLMNIVSTSGDHPHGSYVSSFIWEFCWESQTGRMLRL